MNRTYAETRIRIITIIISGCRSGAVQLATASVLETTAASAVLVEWGEYFVADFVKFYFQAYCKLRIC